MNRKEITQQLSEDCQYHLNPRRDPRIYMAKEVSFDYGTSHCIRVDYMLFKPKNNTVSGIEKGDFYCYEIKSCIDDFKSKNGHNFIGDFNYYVMTDELYKQVMGEIPYGVGVYTPYTFGGLHIEKKAKRKDRSRPVSEMLLMMFRSCNRDVNKERSVKANEII